MWTRQRTGELENLLSTLRGLSADEAFRLYGRYLYGVEGILDGAYLEARELLFPRFEAVQEIAIALFERGTFYESQIAKLTD